MKRVKVLQMVTILFLCMNLAVPPALMSQGAQEETAKEKPG